MSPQIDPAPRVFISSTIEDLEDHRNKAAQAALEMEFLPIKSEYFPASGHAPPLSVCLEKVSEADLLIVIVARRYGWIPDDQPHGDNKSITWLECERAAKEGKEVLAFFLDDSATWPAEKAEAWTLYSAAQNSQDLGPLTSAVELKVHMLREFKKWLGKNFRKTFKTEEELRSHVMQALYAWKAAHSPVGASPQSRPAYSSRESRLSTGAALTQIASDTRAAIETGRVTSFTGLDEFSTLTARRCRGVMVGLKHFYKIGAPYPLSSWPSKTEVIADYIYRFSEYVEQARRSVGRQLASLIRKPDSVIALAEYSRAIFSGLDLLLPNPNINVVVGVRPHAEVKEEFSEAVRKLEALRCSRVRTFNYGDWIEFLFKVSNGQERADFLLFGAEAVTEHGSVIFPQMLAQRELDALNRIRQCGRTRILCVAEDYKVLDSSAQAEIEAIQTEGSYHIIPSAIFHALVTDAGGIQPRGDGVIDVSACRERALEESRAILDDITQAERMVPISYARRTTLQKINLIVLDIDDTITIAGKLEPQVLGSIMDLAASGVVVVLVTGRSAGWAQALCAYLPAVSLVAGENGLAIFDSTGCQVPLSGGPLNGFSRKNLDDVADRLKNEFHLSDTEDNQFRMYERTFVRPVGCDSTLLATISQRARPDFEMISSSIHLHVRPTGWSKADGARYAMQHLAKLGLINGPAFVLSVGDSANDRPLFNAYASTSVGVANIRDFVNECGPDLPKYVTTQREGMGFLEVARALIEAKGGPGIRT